MRKPRAPIAPQYRIVLTYLVFGFVWILGSDWVVGSLFTDPEQLWRAQNLKGWAFIVGTGALLFLMVKRDFDALDAAQRRLVDSYDETIRGWLELTDLRHHETRDHTQRVTRMTLRLARLVGIGDSGALARIERGALMHDIGKIGVPDAVLLKPGPLTDAEREQVRKHPVVAHTLLSRIEFLAESIDIPWCHHERFDGGGYPRGLRGEEIPLAARIFSVVDVWDPLIHARVYKDAWSRERVQAYIAEGAGTQFDPVVVRAFLENYDAVTAGEEPDVAAA